MVTVHHINCGNLHAPPNPPAICHCLLLAENGILAMVDVGIGVKDAERPEQRYGLALIDLAGFKFDPHQTAYAKILGLGFNPADARHAIITHLDPDHIGALADFPDMTVHVAHEEYQHFHSGNPRYLPHQLDHNPRIKTYQESTQPWFGLEARRVDVGFSSEVLLIPLFGHTLGHCGVAVQQNGGWVLHIGDTYFLRGELTDDNHPVAAFSAMRADNNEQRLHSLEQIRRLLREHGNQIEIFGYHDPAEMPR